MSKSKTEPEPPPDETAPFYSDQPTTQDLLNRRAVAETLGTIVDEVWNERQAAEKKENDAGAQRKAFWDHLLQTGEEVTPEDREVIDTEVTERLKDATTEQDVIRIVDEEAKRIPERGAIAGARAFQRMQSRELVGEREHFLAGYADLLEANPRAMKRLLNAYGYRRGIEIQSGRRSDRDALVRWTILEYRWPMLANHLAGRSAGRSDGALIDALMKMDEVRDVAKGLTWDKLRTIAGAPTQPRD